MKMKMNLVLLVLMLAGSAIAVTLSEVQKMKNELEQELSKMQVDTNNKKTNENEKKPISEDPRYKEMLEDILKHDVFESLESIKADNDEKAASDLLRFLIKEDAKDKKSGFLPVIEPPYEELVDLKLKATGHLKDQKILSKKEAEDAYESLLLEDSVKKELSSKRDVQHKRLSDFLVNSSPSQKEHYDSCRDLRSDCMGFKEAGLCRVKAYGSYLKSKCALTCRFCHKCRDELSREQCYKLRKYCHVKRQRLKERMMDYCYESCGYCKPMSPPACEREEFGCCWDNSTAKINPLGTNCPECVDHFPTLCKNFKGLCHKKNRPAKFVVKNCPVKCGLCGDWKKIEAKACFDKVGYEGLCQKWHSKGYCNVGDIAINYCKRSCSANCT